MRASLQGRRPFSCPFSARSLGVEACVPKGRSRVAFPQLRDPVAHPLDLRLRRHFLRRDVREFRHSPAGRDDPCHRRSPRQHRQGSRHPPGDPRSGLRGDPGRQYRLLDRPRIWASASSSAMARRSDSMPASKSSGNICSGATGGAIVFFGRFVALLRAYAALLAGVNDLSPKTFFRLQRRRGHHLGDDLRRWAAICSARVSAGSRARSAGRRSPSRSSGRSSSGGSTKNTKSGCSTRRKRRCGGDGKPAEA